MQIYAFGWLGITHSIDLRRTYSCPKKREHNISSTTNQAICGLLPNQYILPEFLYVFFQAKRSDYLSVAFGSGQPNISQDVIKNTILPIPPYSEQLRIVSRMDILDPLLCAYEKSEEKLASLNKNVFGLLKKSVLQEAIQGKLVSQDYKDEPAAALLERIKAEKDVLIKAGKIKKEKIESVIFRGDDNKYYEQIGSKTIDITDEIPFDIPSTWAYTRLSNIIELLSGRDLEPSQYNSFGKGIPYLTGASNISTTIIINRWTEHPMTISSIGDLLITCKGTVGTMIVNNVGNVHIARQIMAIKSRYCNVDYIRYFLETQVDLLQREARSMIPGISREHLLHMLFPMPPQSEQKRICEKVNDLLSKLKKT